MIGACFVQVERMCDIFTDPKRALELLVQRMFEEKVTPVLEM